MTRALRHVGLYCSATADSETGQVYLKIVNPAAQSVPSQLTFGGYHAPVASIEVLSDPDPQAGNTLANPDAVVPNRGTLRGSNGVFTYQVPANSLTVVTVAAKFNPFQSIRSKPNKLLAFQSMTTRSRRPR